jgi:hypothetical protein
MLPDKDAKCHLTGFEKSCRQLVADGACTRWKMLFVNNPATGVDEHSYDCIDNHAHMLRYSMLRALDQNTASLDKVASETKKAHDEHVTMAAIAVQRSTETIRQVFTSYVSPTDAIPYHENEDQKALPFA